MRELGPLPIDEEKSGFIRKRAMLACYLALVPLALLLMRHSWLVVQARSHALGPRVATVSVPALQMVVSVKRIGGGLDVTETVQNTSHDHIDSVKPDSLKLEGKQLIPIALAIGPMKANETHVLHFRIPKPYAGRTSLSLTCSSSYALGSRDTGSCIQTSTVSIVDDGQVK